MSEAGPHDDAISGWSVSAADFPVDGSAAERIRFLLRYAVLAPSGHNTQPWLFRLSDDGVELRADRTRALPVVDPDDRALIISCGAALMTLRIAARGLGHRIAVDPLPDPSDEDLLARATLSPDDPPDEAERLSFEAIPRRRSNRQAFEDREVPVELSDRLVADAEEEGAWLALVRGEDRIPVSELVAEGDRIQMGDKRFRRELASWVHPNRSRSRDGMRGYGFGFGELMSHAGPLVIRSFDLGKGQAAKDRELAQDSPLLAVFGTDADDAAAWLSAGQALQRAVLRARAADVWSSYLNQPIEVADLRPRLAELVGHPGGFPQLLVRFGYGPDVRPEPRRGVGEVLVEDAE